MTADADVDPVPPYLNPGVIARLSRVPWKTAVTDLKNAGLLPRRGDGARARSHRRISTSALREMLPGYYERVFFHFAKKSGLL